MWPWLQYFVGILAAAYDRFGNRVSTQRIAGTKQQRVRQHVLRQSAPIFTIGDIRAALPGVSDNTIRIVLNQLRAEGHVVSDGTGRAATWRRTGADR